MPANAPEIINLMNAEAGYGRAVHALYWKVHRSVIAGVIESVRTRLVELVAELRAGLGADEDLPSAAHTDQAVNVAIYGRDNRVTVGQAQGAATVVQTEEVGENPGWGRRALQVAAAVATVAVGGRLATACRRFPGRLPVGRVGEAFRVSTTRTPALVTSFSLA